MRIELPGHGHGHQDGNGHRHVARYAWPAGLAAFGAVWYGSESMRHRREQGSGYQLRGERLHVGSRDFLRAAEMLTGAPISDGNVVELRINGDEIFPTFLETIRSARHSVNLTTYVYWQGEIAVEVAETLAAKAEEGVPVNVLLDWVGSLRMNTGLIDRMKASGVSVARFRPLRPYAVRRLNNRTHRKVLVVDGERGMIGGVGIAQEWTGNAQDPDHWRDTHVRVRGPVVRGLQGAFAENWLEATGDALVGDDYLPSLEEIPGGWPMQLVRSRSGVGDTNVEALMFLAIESAQDTLDLTSAYFVPRPAFIRALCEAAERGVTVRVLVPGTHMDKELVRLAGRRTYEELLSCGVHIFEYCQTMLHAKTLVIDGSWTSVGSVNFDNRSFQQNDEATLCVQAEEFARELTEQFERDLEVSDEITPKRWDRRPALHRGAELVAGLARREL